MNKIFVAITILMFAIPVFTEEKERIAVLNLQANNCPGSLALAVSDMLSGRIYDTDVFTLMERDQMDAILREQEFQMAGCTDKSCAVKIGKLLTIRKIIIGSLNKLNIYNIETKIVNVETGKIEANFSAKAENENGLEEATITIARKIAEHYGREAWFGEQAYFISITGMLAAPLGSYGDIANICYGFNAGFGINHLLFRYTSLILSMGFYAVNSTNDSTEQILSLPLIAYGGYQLPILRGLKAVPYLGVGLIIHIKSADEDGRDSLGKYDYTKSTYLDPLLSIRCDVDYMINRTFHLVFSPYYMLLFEKSNTLQKMGVDIGVKLYL